MFQEYSVIPKKRIGAVIGTKGKTKKEIEKKLKVKIKVNSDTGDFEITGNPLNEQKARDIITAIARGFSPENAFKLFDEKYYLKIIWLKEEIGKKPKQIHNKKARIIGSKGRVRKKIEEETKCAVSVYGNTVALIGKNNDIELAEIAISKLIGGMKIGSVYSFIEKRKKQIKKFEL